MPFKQLCKDFKNRTAETRIPASAVLGYNSIVFLFFRFPVIFLQLQLFVRQPDSQLQILPVISTGV
jgi:hypothetical protein